MLDEHEMMQKFAVERLTQVIQKAKTNHVGDEIEKAMALGWIQQTEENYSYLRNEQAIAEILESVHFLLENFPIPELVIDVNNAVEEIETHMKQWSVIMSENKQIPESNKDTAKDQEFEEKVVSVLGAVVLSWEEILQISVLNRLEQYAFSDYFGDEVARHAKVLAEMIMAAKESAHKHSIIRATFAAIQEIDNDYVNDEDWQIWRTWFKRIDPEEIEASN